MRNGKELNVVCSPCLVLAHPQTAYETVLARGFRRLGWDVYLARSGPEAPGSHACSRPTWSSSTPSWPRRAAGLPAIN